MGGGEDSSAGPAGLLQASRQLGGTGGVLRVKIAILTDPESAAGYRLAGLEVAVALDAKEAEEVLGRLIEGDTYALIGVSDALLPDPHRTVSREMRARHLPVLLTTPSLASALAEEGEDAEHYVRRLIIETMGYAIKVQKADNQRASDRKISDP
jgi:V/A-type H+-transporting ATPase subunit F